MKSILARSPHRSFSFSRRFNWLKKLVENDDDYNDYEEILRSVKQEEQADELDISDNLRHNADNKKKNGNNDNNNKKKPLPQMAVSKLRSALTSLGRGGGGHTHSGKVVGTLFGYRRGHVHFAVQSDPREGPEFLIQLASPTNVLVREMASGIMRIALECDKKGAAAAGTLLEEPIWRAYCNGRKCGYGLRRKCGAEEARVLAMLEPISMGAGAIPATGGEEEETAEQGELMYMRARFERVVGSSDSEALYMMNPDRKSSGPELSFYLMRV
ncbi:hypothetical protein SAY86_002662 [Trapa natans]|uniref:Protein MIZU-KUSSEI 1 n=1 Tax=Trapa natans TaxID=22666 RepID=A0AAN7R4Z1_TRANT|nr:hypothetical protein SAY86_002662 [Trapa natans]